MELLQNINRTAVLIGLLGALQSSKRTAVLMGLFGALAKYQPYSRTHRITESFAK